MNHISLKNKRLSHWIYLLEEAQENTTEFLPNQININLLNKYLAQSILQEAVKKSNDGNNMSHLLRIYHAPSGILSDLQAFPV